MIYAYLVTGMDTEGRKDLDRQLAAPLGGWDQVTRRLYAIAEGE